MIIIVIFFNATISTAQVTLHQMLGNVIGEWER